MEAVGRWLRQLHEVTRDFELSEGTRFAWSPSTRKPGHVVTHGDLGPWNMLENDGEFAGVIDWDLARFGDALDDLAEVAFELGPLRENREMLHSGATLAARTARLRALYGGYGDRSVDEILRHVEPLYERRIADTLALAADEREPFVTLADAGHADELRADLDHVRQHFRP